jgi:hypothetical protein
MATNRPQCAAKSIQSDNVIVMKVMLTLLFATVLGGSGAAQPQLLPLQEALRTFDEEHDLAKKELHLLELTHAHPDAGPQLLALAKSTPHTDTLWMAMRGMRDLHYKRCESFLRRSLAHADALVRANAARTIGDLHLEHAKKELLRMFAVEKDRGAIEQASLALRELDVRTAAVEIRAKIPNYNGQTRAWLLQALGTLGGKSDVPVIAAYLDSSDRASAYIAPEALEQLAGLDFGPRIMNGGEGIPTKRMLAARAWWQSHKESWPRCDDCTFR